MGASLAERYLGARPLTFYCLLPLCSFEPLHKVFHLHYFSQRYYRFLTISALDSKTIPQDRNRVSSPHTLRPQHQR